MNLHNLIYVAKENVERGRSPHLVFPHRDRGSGATFIVALADFLASRTNANIFK